VTAEQLLDGEAEAHVRRQRDEVVHSIGVRDELEIRPVLGDLLHAPVEVADVRHGAHDRLAVELQDDAQHPMRRGMRGPMFIVMMSGLFLGTLERRTATRASVSPAVEREFLAQREVGVLVRHQDRAAGRGGPSNTTPNMS
jgi:hypothetical protein